PVYPRLGIQPPDSFRHAFGAKPPSGRRLGLRRFVPESTFLDSRVRGNDGGERSGEGDSKGGSKGNGKPDSRLSRE
ncbi:MAG: hypothetical protein LBI87_02025, partial [Candidatus Accumulibacter sp.]|nr:hypothetical protein [Accumulibacter sp.]